MVVTAPWVKRNCAQYFAPGFNSCIPGEIVDINIWTTEFTSGAKKFRFVL